MSLDLIQQANIHAATKDPDVAHLVIGLHEVISSHTVEGLAVDVDSRADEVHIGVTVAENVRIAKPVHMCFGLLQEQGVQKINLDFTAEPRSRIHVIAHCIFPNAVDVQHLMDAKISIGPGAEYSYYEKHIHADSGGVNVVPKAVIDIAEDARFVTDFELIEGRVGSIDIEYEATCHDRAVMEMNAKISGKADDRINIREIGHLVGEHSRGALTSRIAVQDQARAEIYNKLTASAAYARGHVDCKEILRDEGFASAVPVVEVNHPRAHITHEAALGSVDTKQLETLMARGLDEDAASDLIIRGLLQ
jgi:uncharacterized protein